MVSGGGLNMLSKEKMKLLKGETRKWNSESFGNIQKQIERKVKGIKELDLIDEPMSLTKVELEFGSALLADSWKLSKANESHIKCRKKVKDVGNRKVQRTTIIKIVVKGFDGTYG
ncbi:hypothetical protein RJT34_00182 [Clitoria ternatea]|uniref:Uncharacterized protein n=1 Tax=Clitoria ternatea TaxID=43366 RepID=A0AAN9KHX7_CLITE